MPYEIRTEHDLDELFDEFRIMDERGLQLGGNEFRGVPLADIRFNEWPRLDITLRGEKFDGGVPARILPALYKFQWMIDRAYARSLHTSARGLSTAERQRLELIIRLNPGCTSFDFDLWKALNNAIQLIDSKVGAGPVIVILGLAGIAAGAGIWKAHIQAEAARHNMAIRVQMSDAETERLRIIERLAVHFSHVRETVEDMGEAQNALLRCLDDRDELIVGDELVVNGRVGRRIARKPREVSARELLDGEFFIIAVETGPARSGFRLRVRELGSSDELRISIPHDALPQEQLSMLQRAEWHKTSLRMQVYIDTVGSRVVRATLVSVRLPNE